MKYFTPELFVKLQECEDQSAFRAVNASWEDAIRRYRERLGEIRTGPKDGVRDFSRRKSLHDAHVVDIGVYEMRLTIVLKETTGAGLVSLTYSLVDSPSIDRAAIPEQHQSSPTSWLYDEIDRDEEMIFDPRLRLLAKTPGLPEGNNGQPRWKPIFHHSILLSNGWEIRVRFHRLAVARTTSLFRSTEFSAGAEETLTRSA